MNLVDPNNPPLARTGRSISANEPAPGCFRPHIMVYGGDFAPGSPVGACPDECARLVHTPVGKMRVSTPAGVRTISPAQALWVPAAAEPQIHVLQAARVRSISIASESARGLPAGCTVLHVSALLRALILRLVFVDEDDRAPNRIERLGAVLLDEIRTLTANDQRVPLSANHRLRALCAAFIEEPGSTASTTEWAGRFGMTRKSLGRAFRSELRTTFGAWQRAVRVDEATRRLRGGESVTDVALDLGYESHSAFTAMFRRTTGFPPSHVASRR